VLFCCVSAFGAERGQLVFGFLVAARFGADAASHLDKAGLNKITDTAKPGHQPHFELDFGTAGSNVTLTGLAHWGFLHGTGTYEFGPDGKPIEQPPKPGS
jgi:hypothetical protein